MASLIARWLNALQAALPPGAAFTREPQANLTLLLESQAARLAAAQLDAERWTAQYDPLQATTMLGDWERLLGLPDCCSTGAKTLDQRRQDVLYKLVTLGGQSRAYFIAVAAHLGVEITIDEFAPDTFTWRVNAPMVNMRYFRVGTDDARMGKRLRTWGNTELECVINRLKPAHTTVLFGYS